MKILLVGNTQCHATQRLREECAVRDIVFDAVRPSHIVFKTVGNETRFENIHGNDLMSYDVYIFRGMGDTRQPLSVIAGYLRNHGKRIVEDVFARKNIHIDKFTPTMADDGVPVLEYELLFGVDDEVLRRITYPRVAKALDSSMGRKVRLVHNQQELEDHIYAFGFPLLLQEYVPIAYDYRIMVVDGKALGAVKRWNSKEDFLTIRRGGKHEAATLPQEAYDVAIRAAHVAELSVAGVDILERDNTFFRIEVNMSPQFRVFEQYTGVNVAGEIIDMIVRTSDVTLTSA